MEGEPARYAAVKMEEFARLKQTQLDQALACLKELIPPPPAALSPGFAGCLPTEAKLTVHEVNVVKEICPQPMTYS